MTLPRRKHRNSGRQNAGKRFPAHLQYVRGFACLVENAECTGRIEAMHVDYAGGKGVSMKVSDAFTVPGCSGHHAEQTRTGWQTFERKYGVDALAVAKNIARLSPTLIKAARALGHDAGPEEEE